MKRSHRKKMQKNVTQLKVTERRYRRRHRWKLQEVDTVRRPRRSNRRKTQ